MYIDDYKLLKEKVNFNDSSIAIDNIIVRNYTFTSKNYRVLPGEDSYSCSRHDGSTNRGEHAGEKNAISEELNVRDSQVQENSCFRYHIFSPRSTTKATEVVLLLHGLNEKDWDKYLPWAKAIVERTQKTVVLFPIAFHMNRAPQAWSNSRLMYSASLERKKQLPNLIASSLSNVAISARIHQNPQRFIWSGLQTYYDVIDFMEQCKAGEHELIAPDAQFDFFTYSIGTFLSQILMLANHNGYFEKSKLCMFCGGPVFNRLYPVTKFILDSEANVALYSVLVEHLQSHMKKDERLHHHLNEEHTEGLIFRAMLDYKANNDFRENAFRKLSKQLFAIGLKQDSVIPAYEMVNTLQGRNRDIPVVVEEYDFSFPYKHEDPFPVVEKYAKEVDEAFCKVFDRFATFLNSAGVI